ncbi:hypothetical protein ABWED_0038 [Acinetobacter lwoffii]|nr:hypothetical protein ABWED_0038 [Acinetobacter lwoffii]
MKSTIPPSSSGQYKTFMNNFYNLHEFFLYKNSTEIQALTKLLG